MNLNVTEAEGSLVEIGNNIKKLLFIFYPIPPDTHNIITLHRLNEM